MAVARGEFDIDSAIKARESDVKEVEDKLDAAEWSRRKLMADLVFVSEYQGVC